ncbi:MAG: hypothetical protein H3C36_06250 [Chitinophagaceae bacterium]|nr:hypothetical protein [Chitinophagaceae bacterium]
MTITVLNNQSLFDLAIRYCGTAQAAFAIAALNNISLTGDLKAGSQLELPLWPSGREIARYFASKGHQPATAWNSENSELPSEYEGVSHWAIKFDFVITQE